jgi:hypothetical protein
VTTKLNSLELLLIFLKLIPLIRFLRRSSIWLEFQEVRSKWRRKILLIKIKLEVKRVRKVEFFNGKEDNWV